MSYKDAVDVSYMVGKTIEKVEGSIGDAEVRFYFTDHSGLVMYHRQDCCEEVSLHDVDGDLSSLVGETVLSAEEIESDAGAVDKYDESYTWTFYRIQTNIRCLTMRWYGTSNGYYAEDVDVEKFGW